MLINRFVAFNTIISNKYFSRSFYLNVSQKSSSTICKFDGMDVQRNTLNCADTHNIETVYFIAKALLTYYVSHYNTCLSDALLTRANVSRFRLRKHRVELVSSICRTFDIRREFRHMYGIATILFTESKICFTRNFYFPEFCSNTWYDNTIINVHNRTKSIK